MLPAIGRSAYPARCHRARVYEAVLESDGSLSSAPSGVTQQGIDGGQADSANRSNIQDARSCGVTCSWPREDRPPDVKVANGERLERISRQQAVRDAAALSVGARSRPRRDHARGSLLFESSGGGARARRQLLLG